MGKGMNHTRWTQERVLRLYEAVGTWPKVAEALGGSAAVWWKIGEGGKVSRERLEAVRAYYAPWLKDAVAALRPPSLRSEGRQAQDAKGGVSCLSCRE